MIHTASPLTLCFPPPPPSLFSPSTASPSQATSSLNPIQLGTTGRHSIRAKFVDHFPNPKGFVAPAEAEAAAEAFSASVWERWERRQKRRKEMGPEVVAEERARRRAAERRI